MARLPRVNACPHPDRKHYGKGMCKPCYITAWQKAHPESSSATWFARHPERTRYLSRRARLKRHGITPEQYDHMWEAQGGKCANPRCRSPFPKELPNYRLGLQVDHDHATGKVRGLLCRPCNHALGQVNDDAEQLLGLVEYLEEHRAGPR